MKYTSVIVWTYDYSLLGQRFWDLVKIIERYKENVSINLEWLVVVWTLKKEVAEGAHAK
jgi:hypothetical protein